MRLALPAISCKVTTPADLAEAIVKALGDSPGASWLEPSHGSGVFVCAISKLGVSKKRIVAVDLDPNSAAADILATTLRRTDFLQWAQTTENRFDTIVGNPPYISIKRLPISLQQTALTVVDLDGKPIGKSSNVWYAFVLASIQLLKDGGSLAFVLPSAAEFADYSKAIRRSIGERFSSLELYRCKKPLFDDVQEGTVVAIARGFNEQPFRMRRRTFDSKELLIKGLLESGNSKGRMCPQIMSTKATAKITLNSVAKIRLGGVTGDASYFLMNESKKNSLGLPPSAVTPVVSKAKHLKFVNSTLENWKELKASGERIWLFNPDEKSVCDPRVREYLYLRSVDGGCNRKGYKISKREPWYRTPLPEVADAFMSGMCQNGPWLCINKMKTLSATNTLYVVTFNERDIDRWYMWSLALLTSPAQRQIQRIGRRYADGLIKFEPGPLGQIELPPMRLGTDFLDLHGRAVSAFLRADLAEAKDIADSARA